MKYLIINPGSTSTKLALFDEETCIKQTTLQHSPEALARFGTLMDQLKMRMEALQTWIQVEGITYDVVVGRGGLLGPLPSGVYQINQKMVDELRYHPSGQHASNMGCIIAFELATQQGIHAFTVDPVVVDEMMPIARYSGIAQVARRSIFHALNHKAIAGLHCEQQGCRYEHVNLIVAHMGGGVSVGAHAKGKVIDVINALDGEGAFSPERSGGIPLRNLLQLLEDYGSKTIHRMIAGQGGFVSYCGTNDVKAVLERAKSDEKTQEIVSAFCYQVAKDIATMSIPLKGQVDGIILTGGIAYSSAIIEEIKSYLPHLGPVYVIPGEDEMWALAKQTRLALHKKLPIKHYGGEHGKV
ncbi:MAG: butyrate kinase [Erysipelotrichaceae bacterium]